MSRRARRNQMMREIFERIEREEKQKDIPNLNSVAKIKKGMVIFEKLSRRRRSKQLT